MRILIEHLRQRTIPHDLVEFMDVPYYEGCMIVQIHDHKSTAPSQDTNRVNTGAGKAIPFSVHNYNTFLTPSPYVPYPTQNIIPGKGKRPSDGENDDNSKSAEQKDKENMPAPAVPNDPQRSKPGALRKPKISTIVLHPTPLSEHVELANKAAEARSNIDARRDSRQDNGPLSATVPPTPSTAVPSTPQLSMAPPAKRHKKGGKLELDSTTLYAVESQITLATTAPLILDPVSSASESAALLESLAHPMHTEKPPSPKTRKRTVAEMAADEALAADQERYMLTLDERLSSSTAGAPGGANPADGDGQAGGASFEPRFEKFKVLENIRAQHEENKRMEKLRREEAERKLQQDRERDKLRADAEKKEQEKMRNNAQHAQLMQQAVAQRQQQQEAQRRQLAAQAAQQGMQMPPQVQGQHAHPQPNGMIPNGIQGQPQRFHQQQVSQAQVSSPIVRNGTPQSHSSPMTNNMGNVPMQHSTSSMGGSPARPGSVVQQNHPPMGAPGSHGMVAQRSQQSHAGTPRMPNSTPNVQNTPLNRGMSQTPRMSQGSPLQGHMAPVQQMPMMPNGQPMQMSQQQQQLQQQIMQQRRLAAMQAQQQQNGQMAGLMNGQLTQQQLLQQQLLRQQQQQQQGMQQGMGMPNHALTQAYGAQMAAMAQQRSGMPPNMNQNFMNGGGPNMQQMQMQQMQMRQAQMQAQLQAQAQAQAQQQQQQQPQAQMNQQQLQYNQQVMQQSRMLYQSNVQKMQNDPRYAAGIPEDELNNLKARCQHQAQQMVQSQLRARKQAQMLAAQNGMQQGIPQGMNMQNMQGGMGNGMGM